MNAQFLGINYATDVLSFPNAWAAYRAADSLSSGSSRPNGRPVAPSLGDIAISIQRARAQAREWHHPVEDEIRVLMLHGVLHLLGMDHESDSGRMKRAEIRWRRELGLPVGLIERTVRGQPQ